MRILRSLVCCTMLGLTSLSSHAAGFATSIDNYEFNQPDAKLSPSGEYLAMALVNEGRRSLVVVKTEDFDSIGGVNFGQWQDVGNFHWAGDERLVMEILHREEWDNTPKFYGELYAVKYNGRHGEMVYGYRAGEQQVGSKRKRKEAIYGWGQIVSLMPDDPETILISSTDMPGGSELFEDRQKRDLVRSADTKKLFSTVHKLNLKTRRMSNSYVRSPEPNTTFITDQQGNLVYAYGGEPDGPLKMYRYANDQWQPMNIEAGESFLPVAFSADRSEMVYLGDQGAETGCLMKQTLSSGDAIKLYDSCNLTADSLAMTIDQSKVYAVRKSNGQSAYDVIDRDDVEGDFFAQIVDLFEGYKVDVTARSDDGSYWIVRTKDDSNVSSFYLYSRSKNEFAKIL